MTLLASMLACVSASPSARAQASPEQLQEHQQAAQAAEANNDFASAIHEYKLLSNWLPGNAQVLSNLGVAYYFHDEFERSADVMRRAIGLDKSLYSPHLFLGLSEARLSHPDAAIAELTKAIALNGTDALPHTWLGYEYVAESKFEQAVEELRIASKEETRNVDNWYVLGKCYLDLAKNAIGRLWGVAPDGGRTWQLAAEQFEAQGKKDAALREYLGAFERRPDIAELKDKISELGGTLPTSVKGLAASATLEDAAYKQVHEYERDAKDAFEHVSQIDPDSSRAHQIQGDSDVAADLFDQAILEYKAALARNDRLPGLHGALCYAHSRLGQLQDAVRECDVELTIAPYSAEADVEAGRAHLLAGDDAKAQALLTKALTLDRPPIFTFKLLGQIYLKQQKYAEAAKALRKYLAEEKSDSSAYYLLARACRYTGDTQGMNQAIADYKRTSQTAKNTSEAQKALTTERYPDTSSATENEKD